MGLCTGPPSNYPRLLADITTASPALILDVPRLTPNERTFFEAFPPETCRKWDLIFNSNDQTTAPNVTQQVNTEDRVLDASESAFPTLQGSLEDTLNFDLLRYESLMDWNNLDYCWNLGEVRGSNRELGHQSTWESTEGTSQHGVD